MLKKNYYDLCENARLLDGLECECDGPRDEEDQGDLDREQREGEMQGIIPLQDSAGGCMHRGVAMVQQ